MNAVTRLAGIPEQESASTAREPIRQLPVELVERTESVPVDSLHAADTPRLTGEDAEHVRVLAESQDALPPIVVHRETMRVVDGMHRLRAARIRGQRDIDARFVGGDDEQAFVLAVQANIKHGKPLTLADRKSAATRILTSFPGWSDRMIAAVVGLSPSTVGALRRSTDRDGQSNTRLGQDGTERPLNAANGRALAAKLLDERPDASLREIANLAGVSPSTVHDVRRRLRDGEGPTPPRQRADSGRARETGADDSAVPPPGRAASAISLSTDPALRYTETGRSLLRMLGSRSILRDRSAHLMAVVPPHLVRPVAAMARQLGDAWHGFADELEQRNHP